MSQSTPQAPHLPEYHFRFPVSETESWDCILHEGNYADGSTVLLVHAADSPANRAVGLHPEECIAILTVCLPSYNRGYDEVFIKDYSENAEIAAHLIEAGVIVPTGREVPTGMVTVPVCTYTLSGGEASKETL